MRLTQTELDRVLIFSVAEMARRRRERGLKLNHPEAVALITDEVMERAREGRSYEECVEAGYQVLSLDDLMDGVVDLIGTVRIEAMFDDGARLIVLRRPVR